MSCDPETTISSADIANVKADFELFDNVAESVEDTTTTPGGKTIDTLQGRLKKLGWQTPPVAYTSGISFTISDGTKIINRSGINYAPVPSELPFTTTGTWGGADEDKFYQISISADSIGGLSGFTFSTVTSMSTKTTVGGDVVAPVLGQKFSTLGRSAANDGGGADYVVTNDAANTYDKIDLGGGLTAALIIGSVLNARVFGLSTSATPAANKLVMDALISQAFATGQTIYIPLGYYECEPFTIVPVGTQRTIHIKGEFSCRSGEIIPTSADSIKQAASVLYFPNATGTATAIEYGVSGGTGELHGPILEDLYILGPEQEAGANPTNNNTGLRITDGCRDMILRNVMISQWRAGLITFDIYVFTTYSCKITRCQIGAIWADISNRVSNYELKITDCTYGAYHSGPGNSIYFDPWFEGQPQTNDREMKHAIVIGGDSSLDADAIKDISIFGGWFEQIQEEALWVGVYDNGLGAGGGATPNFVSSPTKIDRIRVHGDGHWDSIGADSSGRKIKIDASATNIQDGAVRVYSEMSNFDFSQVSGDATKVKSGNNFESHAANGYPISRWVTDFDAGSSGGINAGMKTGIPDASATTFLNFSVPNSTLGAVFRVTYEIISNTERSLCAGDVLVALGRASGAATQGGVTTPNNTAVNIASTESNSTPVFALTGVQAKDTADTTTETIGLQLTQDNTNSAAATISYTVEQVCGTRQAGVGSNYIDVSQA